MAAGEPGAPDLLARAYLDSGDWPGCIEWLGPLRRAGARGVRRAAGGGATPQLGDVDNAEEALRLAVTHGEAVAANDLAILLRDTDRMAEAVHVLRHAAEGGDEQAPANLVALYLEAGDLIAAAEAAERYADESRPDTIVALGDVRAAESRPDAAEQAYRRAIQLGGVRAHTAYGQFLLAAYGDAAGAEDAVPPGVAAQRAGLALPAGPVPRSTTAGPRTPASSCEVAAGWGDRDGRPTCWTRSTAWTRPTTAPDPPSGESPFS